MLMFAHLRERVWEIVAPNPYYPFRIASPSCARFFLLPCWHPHLAVCNFLALCIMQALQYSPFFEGLPGGDGHGGWLVSSSKQLLVLWQCNLGGGRGEISLMVRMHTQQYCVW